jgi:Fe-S cluster assembly protein SufD
MTIQVSTVPETATVADRLRVDRTAYLNRLVQRHSSVVSPFLELEALKNTANTRLLELAIPSTRDEAWRFTDLSSLLQIEFEPVSEAKRVEPEAIAPFALPDSYQIVVVNGIYRPELSRIDRTEGLWIGNLAHSVPAQPTLWKYLGQQLGKADVFTELNTACFTDAVVLWVGRDRAIDTPVHVIYLSTSHTSPVVTYPRCLVVAEAGSRLTLVEQFAAAENSLYWTNAVTELWLDAEAQVNHTRVQQDSPLSFHIGRTVVSQEQASHYTDTAIHLGAALSRYNADFYSLGEQTQTRVNGLTMLRDKQLADTHSSIVYSRPYGSSRQLHKCVVDDQAHAVFNGRVVVPKLAQQTDAGQLTKTLLLSPKARIDAKPQLEIVADNVKCTHGATVSELEHDEMFYLQSRGIDADRARQLLVYAFAHDVLSQVPIVPLRDRLTALTRTQFA